ncbi:ATP-grasp domain-containing protein [Hydrogenophaga sp. PAMC20947]|nr:ATP-grasp domain-containing protein [Hydrogenophaga sp. PAMC20947]
MTLPQRTLVLFNHDWDAIAHQRLARTQGLEFDEDGFDLFSFPSNARLAWFDMARFVDGLARQAKRKGWTGVTSNQEQFGALAAALLAERMGWPGTPVKAILACQHKLYARQVLEQVAPEANVRFQLLDAEYGAPIPEGLTYPLFVKPIKAAFSVLAKRVESHEELHRHTRFGRWELWVIRRLVEPFERMVRERLGPGVPSAHRMLLEEPVQADQFNLDGYVFNGEIHAIGVVDAIMFPRTQAFMRHEAPSRLPAAVQVRAQDVARRFLQAVGFNHGLFNMEFFYDAASDRLAVIEFNPRMASQYSDLYQRVLGVDMHALALALAHGRDPANVPRQAPSAGMAASFVYRAFDPGDAVTLPTQAQRQAMLSAFPDGLLFPYPKSAGSIARDFKWLGSYRFGIIHLGGRDAADLQERCELASALLGWTAPYAEPLMEASPGTSPAQAGHTPVLSSGSGGREVPSTAQVNP